MLRTAPRMAGYVSPVKFPVIRTPRTIRMLVDGLEVTGDSCRSTDEAMEAGGIGSIDVPRLER